MGTDIRPELSKKNEYWLPKHRYYELKHFCLQYVTWRQARAALSDLYLRPADIEKLPNPLGHADMTAKIAENRAYFSERIEMVEQAAREASHDLFYYIIMGVTQGVSYDNLRLRHGCPCGKDTYYDAYRRFFWILSGLRN